MTKVHGNGVLLLDNAYEGEGKLAVYLWKMSMIILAITRSTDLYAVDDYIDESPTRSVRIVSVMWTGPWREVRKACR